MPSHCPRTARRNSSSFFLHLLLLQLSQQMVPLFRKLQLLKLQLNLAPAVEVHNRSCINALLSGALPTGTVYRPILFLPYRPIFFHMYRPNRLHFHQSYLLHVLLSPPFASLLNSLPSAPPNSIPSVPCVPHNSLPSVLLNSLPSVFETPLLHVHPSQLLRGYPFQLLRAYPSQVTPCSPNLNHNAMLPFPVHSYKASRLFLTF